MRSAVAPAASTISISATEAVSKQEPSDAEQRQHLRGGVRLHGVEHAGVRQRLGEGLVVVAHDVEIDDEDRSFVLAALAALARNSRMRSVMRLSPKAQAAKSAVVMRVVEAAVVLRWGHTSGGTLSTPLSAALDWMGRPRTARLAMMDKPLR